MNKEVVLMDLLDGNSLPGEIGSPSPAQVALEDLVPVDDRAMALFLIGSNVKYYRVTSLERKMSFWFIRAEASPYEQRYLSGRPILVDFHDIMRAEEVWKSHLARSKSARFST